MKEKATSKIAASVDEYIAAFPRDVRRLLTRLRKTIQLAAPEAEEVVSYQMPAYKYHGMLVYFAAHKKHIGFYPTSTGIEAFKEDLSAYKGAKGSVQFPLNKPIPFPLIAKIVRYRVKENKKRAALKRSPK